MARSPEPRARSIAARGPGAAPVLALLLAVSGAAAAPPSTPPPRSAPPSAPGLPTWQAVELLPFLNMDSRATLRTVRPRPPLPPLDAASLEELRRAQLLRRQGALGPARQRLEELLRRHPHEPAILAELVELHNAAHDWAALERLCRSERLALRDSLFLALPLVRALTYQNRHREAAQVAIEAVVATPEAAGWAGLELRNLALANPPGVRQARDELRVAWTRNSSREDLLRLLAQQEWFAGNLDRALELLESPLRVRGGSAALLQGFADERLQQATHRDSAAAARACASLARQVQVPEAQRLAAARRVLAIRAAQGDTPEAAAELVRALRDLPAPRWGQQLGLALARGLREGGHVAESRELLERLTVEGKPPQGHLLVERALGELRDGRPAEAQRLLASEPAGGEADEEARYHLGEALFFGGQTDSAKAVFERLARDHPGGEHADAALDRVYLIEDAQPPAGLLAYAWASYLEWRGEKREALAVADSLYARLPPAPLWARAALLVAELREDLGQYSEALAPLAALADSLPQDRLAPLARKRRGDIYRLRLKDDAKALDEYEECLARYPRAWLSPEVRRMVETLRRARTM